MASRWFSLRVFGRSTAGNAGLPIALAMLLCLTAAQGHICTDADQAVPVALAPVAQESSVAIETPDAGQTPQSVPGTTAAPADARDPNVYLSDAVPKRPFVKKFATNFLLDQKDIWLSPFHMTKSSAKWWVLAGSGTAALIAVDHRVSQALPFSGTSVNFGNTAAQFGQWYTVFPVAGVFWAIGAKTGDDQAKETGILSLEAMADADIVGEVLKLSTQRQRPRDGDGGGHFWKGGSSFPSGHSTQAWALAAVIADEYSDHKWVPFAAYGYATMVSVARVLAQEHFTSDVFVGGMIGFFVGRYVVHTQRVHGEHVKPGSLRSFMPDVSPTFSPAGKTVTLAWNY